VVLQHKYSIKACEIKEKGTKIFVFLGFSLILLGFGQALEGVDSWIRILYLLLVSNKHKTTNMRLLRCVPCVAESASG